MRGRRVASAPLIGNNAAELRTEQATRSGDEGASAEALPPVHAGDRDKREIEIRKDYFAGTPVRGIPSLSGRPAPPAVPPLQPFQPFQPDGGENCVRPETRTGSKEHQLSGSRRECSRPTDTAKWAASDGCRQSVVVGM